MTASSVTGRGSGDSNRFDINELIALAKAPAIIFAGTSEATENPHTSPPSNTNTVVFPYALSGGADKYVVMLTTINAGNAYVFHQDDDDDGNFTGFSFIAEYEGTVMYLVAKIGSRPNL